MKNFALKLNKELNVKLQAIDLEESSIISKAQKSILCIKDALSKLKTFILNYTFVSEEEEILFFKEIKPGILSQLIYFVKINNIESKRPMGSFEIQQNYLFCELEKLTLYFNSHLEFYRYYRMNSTFLDDKFFVRGREDLHLHLDNLMVYIDPDFSTSQDYMVAKIIANDRLEVFLKTELDALSIKNSNPNYGQVGISGNNSLQWTDNKTALVELIYALYACGSLNDGRCEIRVLTAIFEQIFNVRLTDIYRTYLEIKVRSIPTKYIDNLKTALLRKMEEDF
ncbi:MAG: RteC domain-containing protein [Paludibacter sp.]|jgi:hypothetical protein|nr:RteC domain-containing protein [Paludibacter sp.]